MLKRSLVVAALLSTVAFGAADNKYEVEGALGGIYDPSGDDLKNDLVYGLRAGARVFDNKVVQIAYDRADGMKFHDDPGYKTDLNRYMLNALIEHPDYTELVPYLIVGAGYEDWSKHANDVKSDGAFNWGAGLRYVIADYFHLKAEAKQHINFNGFSTVTTTLNAVVPFGYDRQPEPEVVVVEEVEEVIVVENIDSDGDGVYDRNDECPGTPHKFKVNDVGCPTDYKFDVQFAFDSSKIQPQFKEEIVNFAEFMDNAPDYQAELQGYTDTIGNDAYNQKLSQRRADAVKAELEKYGIASDRLKAVGYGESDPVASNKTKEGRYQNRRVNAKITEIE
jgi:OOP family OmpA-OmpF porin